MASMLLRMMVKSGLADVWICECHNRVKARVRDRVNIRVRDMVKVRRWLN